MTEDHLVDCAACGGEGIDDSGEFPIVCPACNGTTQLLWSRVVWLGMEHWYTPTPAEVVEKARAAVVDFGTRTS